MRLKSYFSGTVEAAMTLARREMGDDALLIHSRPSSPEARHLGAYEVVFGIQGGPAEGEPRLNAVERDARRRTGIALQERAQPDVSASVQLPSGPEPAAGPDLAPADLVRNDIAHRDLAHRAELAQQVANLQQEMERLVESIGRQNAVEPPPRVLRETPVRQISRGEVTEESIYESLLQHDMDPALAREVASGKPLEDTFEVDATLGRSGSDRAVVALIGPPGAGKTSTLAKLAVRYGLLYRRPVQIFSADTLRIGAADQLRIIASLLGIRFGIAETPLELDRMLERQSNAAQPAAGQRHKELILIDTPGLGKADMEDGLELAELIAAHPDIDSHLVLPASMKAQDLAEQVERFGSFQPKKLIFSRLDETIRYGNLVSLAARSRFPISFLTQGQRIPDDLEPATKDRLMSLLTSPRAVKAPALGRGAAA